MSRAIGRHRGSRRGSGDRSAVPVMFLAGVALLCPLLAGCPQTSTGGPHHTPPTVEIHQ